MIKVLIADDQELIRQSLQIVLNSKADIEVCDVAADGQEVIRSIRKERPDVILMDIRMPKMDGVQCTKIIKENYPEIKIIILTTFDDDEYVYNALKFGASGYLLKGVSMDELENAIKTVYSGRAMINPDIATKVFKLFSQMAQADYSITVGNKAAEELTRTEWKIIAQVGKGSSNKEIAERRRRISRDADAAAASLSRKRAKSNEVLELLTQRLEKEPALKTMPDVSPHTEALLIAVTIREAFWLATTSPDFSCDIPFEQRFDSALALINNYSKGLSW